MLKKRTGHKIHSLDPGSVVLYAILYVDEEVDTILYFGPIFFSSSSSSSSSSSHNISSSLPCCGLLFLYRGQNFDLAPRYVDG